VTIVDSGWGFCSTFNVFIDAVDLALQLLCRTMITRREDDESIRCEYVVVSIGFMWNKMMFYMINNCMNEFIISLITSTRNECVREREGGKENARIPYGSWMMNERHKM
jgi:predicted CDP-diglyceride synthetase/phosphatidate cytidylyltransferase